MLQKTDSTAETEKMWVKQWNGPIFFPDGISKARDICILFDPKCNLSVKINHRDDDERILIAEDKEFVFQYMQCVYTELR